MVAQIGLHVSLGGLHAGIAAKGVANFAIRDALGHLVVKAVVSFFHSFQESTTIGSNDIQYLFNDLVLVSSFGLMRYRMIFNTSSMISCL